jgi:acetate kinase
MSTISGLVMGTRIGDIDPGVLIYMQEVLGYDWQDVKRILNKESGLLGLCGDNDLRNISDNYLKGDELAIIALSIYVYRIIKYIGAYIAVIGKIDAIVFTAGVGENSSLIRDLVTKNMSHLGISISMDKNNQKSSQERDLSNANTHVKTLVIPTNEELEIARQAYVLLNEGQ